MSINATVPCFVTVFSSSLLLPVPRVGCPSWLWPCLGKAVLRDCGLASGKLSFVIVASPG